MGNVGAPAPAGRLVRAQGFGGEPLCALWGGGEHGEEGNVGASAPAGWVTGRVPRVLEGSLPVPFVAGTVILLI